MKSNNIKFFDCAGRELKEADLLDDLSNVASIRSDDLIDKTAFAEKFDLLFKGFGL
jgi:hypothetical protein